MATERPTIFLAHSSLDKSVARVIRNMFEELEHEALLLHLEQNMTDDYLHDLIRREIDARDWMVIVSSRNARQSRWVPLEEAYARFYGKPIYSVNIDKLSEKTDMALGDCLRHCILSISQNIRVFISYSHRDKAIAEEVRQVLLQDGYEVWFDTEIMPGTDWRHEIDNAIEKTLERGCIVALISANSAQSRYMESEVRFAFEHKQPRIIPSIIDPSVRQIPPYLSQVQYVDVRGPNGLLRLRHALHAIRTSFCE